MPACDVKCAALSNGFPYIMVGLGDERYSSGHKNIEKMNKNEFETLREYAGLEAPQNLMKWSRFSYGTLNEIVSRQQQWKNK